MHKGRLEAFSDGVIAIIITIMVLEMKIPHGESFSDLKPLLPVVLSYTLSFIYIAIYWNNHHHLMQATKSVNGAILWSNMHLLFWLTLVPFATAWMGENNFGEALVALYGVVLFMAGFAYYVLAHNLVRHHGQDSPLARAIGQDLKGKISIVIYALAIPLGIYVPAIACALYVGVAILWLIPDRRIEDRLG